MATPEKTSPDTTPPFIIPDGLDIQSIIGPLSGKTLYKVRGFEMPFMGSAEDAVRVYQRLKHAYETGYYAGNHSKK